MTPAPPPALHAECPSCGKRYRVPHADREWTCKSCGDPLEIELPSEPVATGSAPPRRAAGAARGAARRRGSGATNLELRKAARVIGILRILFGFNLALSGVVLLLGLALLGRIGETRPEVIGMVAGGGLGVAFALAGLLDVRRHPFGWALTLLVMRLFADASKLAEGDLGAVGWTMIGVGEALAWFCAIEAYRLKKLLAAHPDALVSRRLRGERGGAALGMDPEESVGRRHRAAARGRARREGGRTALLAAGLVIAVVAAVSFVLVSGGPTDPEETIEAFATAWNAGDLDGMAAHFPEGSRAKLSRGLERLAERRGWLEAGFPQAESMEWGHEGEIAEGLLHTSDGDVLTGWRWQGGRWVLTVLDTR